MSKNVQAVYIGMRDFLRIIIFAENNLLTSNSSLAVVAS